MGSGKINSRLLSVAVVVLAVTLPLMMNRSKKEGMIVGNTSSRERFFSPVNHKNNKVAEISPKRGKGVGSKDILTRNKNCEELNNKMKTEKVDVSATTTDKHLSQLPKVHQQRGKDGPWHHRGSSREFFQKNRKLSKTRGITIQNRLIEIANFILDFFVYSI